MTPREAQVVVLAKSPQPGKVKTRLTPPYTPHEAADLALAALLDTLEAAAGASVRRCLLVLEGASGPWLPKGFEVRQQRGVGLDERITHALADAYVDLPLPVLLVGMDTPQITSDDLDGAVDQLLQPGVDAVLGPAQDGGYWLLGIRRPRPRQVLGVAMSRPDTGARQLERLRSAGLRVRVLGTLRDVDDAADAHAAAHTAPGSAFAATLARLHVGGAA